MSNSVRPHRRQPTRLPYPWDSPGKNTGVGCHFLLQCMKVKSEREVTQSSLPLSDHMDCSLPGSSARGIFQARILEWVAIAFSDLTARSHLTQAWKALMCICVCSVAMDSFQLQGTVAHHGSSVHCIFQARLLEWVAISYFRKTLIA